jgi:hypothetical protein
MRPVLRLSLVAVAFALGGCAATVQRPSGAAAADSALKASPAASKRVVLLIKSNPSMQRGDDWNRFTAEWRTAVTTAASDAGKKFTYLDEEPTSPAAEPGALIVLTINDYRYVSPGARFGLGIMTGNAFIDADARFYEQPGNRELGARKYTTSSSAWQGVFSAMTDKQVQAIATEMVKELDR